MLKTVVTAVALGISLLAAQPTEAEIMVNCIYGVGGGDCLAKRQPTTLPNDITYYIPATGENEPGSEVVMQINFPGFTYRTFSINGGPMMGRPGVPAFFEVLDPDGSVSDRVILIPTTGVPQNDEIIIDSDPLSEPPFTYQNLGPLAVEGDQGVTVTMRLFLGNSQMWFDFGFDGEFVFDPFGVGVDTSDSVRVSGFPPEDFVLLGISAGETPGRVPEPSSLAVLAFALAAFGTLLLRGGSRQRIDDGPRGMHPIS
jgi:hypothetical protein